MSLDFICAAATVGVAAFLLWCVWSLLHGEIPYSAKAKRRKAEKTVFSAARTFVLSYEDLPAYRAGGEFGARMQNLRDALAARNLEECRSLLEYLDAPKPFALGREWLDILVVSISVAMAFRAYFYEPFNIPTGSMQPTLYGNHSVPCSPAQATVWDKGPLKWCKWLVTGTTYECFTAPFAGRVVLVPTNTGHYDMRVSGVNGLSRPMLVPTDVLSGEGGDAPRAYRGPVINGIPLVHESSGRFVSAEVVPAGRVLWSGYVVTGDFLFVNRWLWNFRHPRVGDVMIFNTTGISERNKVQERNFRIMPGTHYIKRMTGTPGDRLAFRPDGKTDALGRPTYQLHLNGQIPMEPERIAQIQRREKFCPEAARPYDGYRPAGHLQSDQEIALGPDEYWACGDNSLNSLDSRYWGPVPSKNLRGIAGGVFWPFSHRWGPIK